ncbi:hypothetical protein K402DRAFT_304529, partial [Aulographum hederae CBS 113979]
STANPNSGTTPSKRRRIRKGTFSCWACKHRKTRCEFRAESSSESCVFCHRRGIPCIGQDKPEPDSSIGFSERRPDVHPYNSNDAAAYHLRSGDASSTCANYFAAVWNLNSSPPLLQLDSDTPKSRLRMLSSHLHSKVPRSTVLEQLMIEGKFSRLPIHINKMYSKDAELMLRDEVVDQEGSDTTQIPSPAAHPIQFARKMIQLALCSHQLSSSAKIGFSPDTSASDTARFYVEMASRYVTSQDYLVDSVDGLETLILEACYHINVGSLRTCWLLFRRALSIAHTMNLSRQAETHNSREERLWFRLNLGDRFISSLLGLPAYNSDDTFAEKDTTSPSERLESIHAVLVGRIIERNLRLSSHRRKKSTVTLTSTYDDTKATEEIDHKMKIAMQVLPLVWWRNFTVHDTVSDTESLEQSARVALQMHHYFILVVLHQPYIVEQCCSPRSATDTLQEPCQDYGYSTITALFAGREFLSRYMAARKVYSNLSYRSLDDKALVASMVMLLAHVHGHRLGRNNVLAHQRAHDINAVHEVVALVEETARFNPNLLSSSIIEMLRNLLRVEAKAAEGMDFTVTLDNEPADTKRCSVGAVLRFPVPYFGSLDISP